MRGRSCSVATESTVSAGRASSLRVTQLTQAVRDSTEEAPIWREPHGLVSSPKPESSWLRGRGSFPLDSNWAPFRT